MTEAPVPPQNLDAEEYVLGAVMLARYDGGLLAALAETGLRPDDFYRESHGHIYAAALRLHARGEPTDAIALAAELDAHGLLAAAGGPARFHMLAALVPATANAPHHARLIVEAAVARDLVRAGALIQRLGFERPDGLQAALAAAQALTTRLTEERLAAQTHVEPWRAFEQSAGDHVPMLVEQLWPAGSLGFIAAPAKKGKTWVGLTLALAVATGKPFLGEFAVPAPRPVLYIALEGHRSALRARIGALARGMGLDPDSGDLDALHFMYKPPGVNLAEASWAYTVRKAAAQLGAGLVVVDVLRAAAVLQENSNESFAALRANLMPLLADGPSLALLHHFGKLTEIGKERTPGERMAGAGAMFGALDTAIYITGSDAGARKLRLEFEGRDTAGPGGMGVYLTGEGSGVNGGFAYRDSAVWRVTEAPGEDDLKAPAPEIYAWLEEQGGEATGAEIRLAFEITLPTLQARQERLEKLGVEVLRRRGKPTVYRINDEPGSAQIELGAGAANAPQQPLKRPDFTTSALDPHFRGETAETKGLRDTPKDPANGAALGVQKVPICREKATPKVLNPYFVGVLPPSAMHPPEEQGTTAPDERHADDDFPF